MGHHGYVHSGAIDVLAFSLEALPTFVDYLTGGIEINLVVGIDFTGSNGDPRDPRSLHYIDPAAPNEYIRAIRSVGNVLAYYDSDKMFPVFGFGAQLTPGGPAAHDFNVTLDNNPFVAGVEGIVQA